MQILPHDLDHEFPEFAGLMRELRGRDERLTELFRKYDALNDRIVDIEENEKVFQDAEFEDMKKSRLRVKDEIYAVLRAHAR